MSVATQHSPFAVGSKRLYESDENEDHLQRLDSSAGTHKRYRQRGSPAGACGADSSHHASYSVGHATLAALRGLFPDMSDKVISDVLSAYGDNIDAAIKHLTNLRLTTVSSVAVTEQASAALAGTAASEEQQQQQQQQQQSQQTAAATGPPDNSAGPPSASGQPKSAEEWVEFVVQEMAAAKDMADARARASGVLQAFEQAAVEHSKTQASPAEFGRLRAQLAEVLRENHLLKRAVAIQNTRLQELSGKETEVGQLRQLLESCQQKVHALEVQNYSLALHLKQATDGKDALAAAGFKNNPDVF